MKKTLSLSSLLLIGLSTTACVEKNVNLPSSPQTIEQATTSIPQPSIAPQISSPLVTSGEGHQLKTVQGPIIVVQERSNGFVFPQYEDKIVLLQIFGKECKYCFEEMPFIQRIHQRYNQHLNVVALQAQPNMTPAVAQNIIQKFQMNYPIVDRDEAKDLLLFIEKTYNWAGTLPYMLIIKNGVTEYSFEGEIDHGEFERAIRSLM